MLSASAGSFSKPITLRFFQRRRNRFLRKWFQFGHDRSAELRFRLSLTSTPKLPQQSSRADHNNRSTTRSFNGMIALSVIVMFSGQTFVQHFVMLQ